MELFNKQGDSVKESKLSRKRDIDTNIQQHRTGICTH